MDKEIFYRIFLLISNFMKWNLDIIIEYSSY